MYTKDVEVAFGELGRVLDIEVDEFDKIMSTITTLIGCWMRYKRFNDELPKEVILRLKRAAELLIECKGCNVITHPRTRAMDLLQGIPLILMKDIVEPPLNREVEMILRPKEVEEIARLLLVDSNSPVSIFPIVGIPGSGKTSLAYLLYHHHRLRRHFNSRGWVGWEDISQVVKQIDFDHNYLIVLEEFPNEDGEKWFDLLEPLLSAFAKCKPGTKIIVTSSSASLDPCILLQLPLAKGAPYLLRPLQHYDFLAFFKSIISFREIAEVDRNPHLNDTALKIFNKCSNNLRVIRIVANILSFQPPSKWKYFNEDVFNIQNPAKHILPTFDLIQQNQQHLNLFSLFPLDYEFNKEEVYQLWDARQKLTEPFKEMFETLLDNESLFKCSKRDRSGVIVSYKVQPLVHEVTKHSARNVCLLLKSPTDKAILYRIRHVSFIDDLFWRASSSLLRNLESLLLLPSKSCNISNRLKLNFLLDFHLKGLQVLDLAILDCRNCLNYIGRLKYLKYLKLGVSSESLPECITNLKFLQTLDLQHSRVRELPEGFHKLTHLKHLYIGDGLIDLPPRFRELTGLQTLDIFIVGNNNGLDALACFTHLAGKLRVRYQNGREVHVLPEDTTFLKDKKLHELLLEWSYLNAEPSSEKYKKEDDMELELLQPSSTLKILTVKNWKGERFPQWSVDQFSSLLSNLVSIHIADCSRCKYLPFISKLGCLRSLDLWGLIALEWIENYDNNSMVSSETPYFPSLEHLSLVNLPRLKGWSRVEEHNADYEKKKQRNLHRLYDLRLSGCPELISMPHMPTLHSLEASNCHRDLLQHFFSVQASVAVSSSSASAVVPVLQKLCSLKVSNMSIAEPLPMGFECLTTLEELSLSWLYNLRILPELIGHLILLRQLVIRHLPNLLDLPESLAGLSALEHMEIRYCPRLKQVPSYFSELKSLQRLQIKECVNLERRCQQPDGEDWPLIQHIPNVILG